MYEFFTGAESQCCAAAEKMDDKALFLCKYKILCLFPYFQMPRKYEPWKKVFRAIDRQNKRRAKRRPIVKQDWSCVWPRGTPANTCEVTLTNRDLPRLGNNWIKSEDGCVTLRVGNHVKSVNVQLRDINQSRMTRLKVQRENGHLLLEVTQGGGAFYVHG